MKPHQNLFLLITLCPLMILAQERKTAVKPGIQQQKKQSVPVKNNPADTIKRPSSIGVSTSTQANVESKPAEVFIDPEQPAEYPGGDEKLIEFLSQNMRYPAAARDSNIQGRVLLQFQVCEDGQLCDLKVLRSVDKQLDEEAMRVVKKMEKWKPAKQGGKKVSSTYVLPIMFQLE